MGAAVRFIVLTRRAYTESLTQQGMVTAGPGEDPAALARQHVGGDCLELVLAPLETVTWVIEPQAGAPA